jgi:hypothetical protein
MSIKRKALAEGGTPTSVTRFDGVRVSATDYHPVWLDSLADDVTLEGSAMNGVVHGAEAVRSIVPYIRTLYDDQEVNFAGRTARTASWRTTPPGSTGSRSATSSWSPATPPGRRSTSWPTTGPGTHCCSCPG